MGSGILITVWLVPLITVVWAGAERPHIIFILADDLGWDDVSLRGTLTIPTPNIDVIGRDGIILNNYYTTPLCTPTRGALMTGKYPIRLGLQHNVIKATEPWGLPLQERILPQYLKELGYSTHGIGKWHLGFYKSQYLPTNRGFDSFFGCWSGSTDYFSHVKAEGDFRGYDLHDGERTAREYEGLYATDVFTSRAKSIIEGHNSSRPLFLFLSHQAVHTGNKDRPLQSPPKYSKRFRHLQNTDRKIYAGMVGSVDDSIGEIFESLELSGLLNDSIVIFSTDNGGAVRDDDESSDVGSNWPLRGAKFTLWEGGIRGTAWIWSSKLRDRKRVDNRHSFHVTDWLPTLLTAAGGNFTKLGKIDGLDQWQSLLGSRRSKRNHMLLNIDPYTKIEGLRKGPFKLLKGSFENGTFDGWFDEEGPRDIVTSDSRRRNIDSEKLLRDDYSRLVANSAAWKVLRRNYRKTTSMSSLMNYRMTRTVCQKKDTDRPCFLTVQSRCLFNVVEDPCEFDNVAETYPEIADDLEVLLSTYRKQSVTPLNQPSDAEADPKLHGGVWVPWKS